MVVVVVVVVLRGEVYNVGSCSFIRHLEANSEMEDVQVLHPELGRARLWDTRIAESDYVVVGRHVLYTESI